MTWSAAQYLQFEEERTRPVQDLLAAIPPVSATTVVDLGCGPGNSTELLCARYPEAQAIGVDSSADMLTAARKRLPHVAFSQADISVWRSGIAADIILANAALHWVPDHETLFPRLVAELRKGGSLAVQMPDNMAEPSQLAMDEAAATPEWAHVIAASAGFRARMLTADAYIRLVRPLVSRIDVWRTEYMHVLPGGVNAIVEWFRGSGLRPFLAPLNTEQQASFLACYRAKLEAAYPKLPDGSVILRFPRLFIVATL